MSRCAICGKEVYEGEYWDYYDDFRDKILFVCDEHDSIDSTLVDKETGLRPLLITPESELEEEYVLERPEERPEEEK